MLFFIVLFHALISLEVPE